MRRLIVNADDFGLTLGVNRAILEAHKQGIVTSCTLMAGGGAFADAAQLAQSAPALGVGCHIVLVDGEPLLDKSQVKSLTEKADGCGFRTGLGRFALAALTGRFSAEQIEQEATAQIRKLQSAGIAVSHIDTHKHTHIFPQVLKPLLRAAKFCGVCAVRNPFEPIVWLRLARTPILWKRGLQMRSLSRWAHQFRQAVREANMITPDGTVAILATGSLDESVLEAILKCLPRGTWEFVCHPGYNDASLQSVKTRLRKSRETELRLLTAPSTRALLAQGGVELISYRQLT